MNDIGRMTGAARLEFVRTFPVTPDVLWAYLVEDEHRRKWLCGGDVEPREGGRIVFDFDHRRLSSTPPPERYADQEAVRFEGVVRVWDPPRRLAFSWPEADGEQHTEVTLSLRPTKAGTELHLVHEHLHSAEYRVGAAAGWHAHLDLLGDLWSERPVRDFWLRHTELEIDYARRLPGDS